MTLGVLRGHFEGTLGSLWIYFWDYFGGSLGSFWGYPVGPWRGYPGVTLRVPWGWLWEYSGITLKELWGWTWVTLGSLWRYLWDYIGGSLGSLCIWWGMFLYHFLLGLGYRPLVLLNRIPRWALCLYNLSQILDCSIEISTKIKSAKSLELKEMIKKENLGEQLCQTQKSRNILTLYPFVIKIS